MVGENESGKATVERIEIGADESPIGPFNLVFVKQPSGEFLYDPDGSAAATTTVHGRVPDTVRRIVLDVLEEQHPEKEFVFAKSDVEDAK